MTHVCMNWYDVWIFYVWIFFAFFFEKKFELFPISLLFWIHGIILLWYFFTFSNHFFGPISLLTNTFFLIISFETLFEWHPWKCQRLEKAWMMWWRLTRKLPRFELVLGQKCVWAFLVINGMKEMMGTSKKLPLVWEPRMVVGCQGMFDFSQMRKKKRRDFHKLSLRSSQPLM